MKKEKLTIKVLIEGNQSFTETYLGNQKLQVIIHKTLAALNINEQNRVLKREDGTPLTDYTRTIDEVGLWDGECLRFFVKAPKPDRDKGFAYQEGPGQGYHWQNDPENKTLLEAEMGLLERGLGGDFKLLNIEDSKANNGKLVALGFLHFGTDGNQAIRIVFPSKYPYAAPKVYPVQLSATTNENETSKIPYKVTPFNKGNQYSDGSVCLFRPEFWNGKEHNVGWLLRRTQRWLISAHSESGFNKEEIVEEYPGEIKPTGYVLLPKPLTLPETGNKGELILQQFKANNYLLANNILPQSPFRYILNNESFTWYRFKEGITFKEAFPITNLPVIMQHFQEYFGENLLDGNLRNIALYLPSDHNPWHFMKVGLVNHQFSIQYYQTKIISESLYWRTSGIFSDMILSNKKVTIVGLGALGSMVAKSLGKNGVGHFNVFDCDNYELGNGVRHEADFYFIGEPKVNVIKTLLLGVNPSISVDTYHTDVMNDAGALERCLSQSDLCLVLTGEDRVDYMMNDIFSQRYDIPFVFARVSPGAMSGAIQIVDKKSSCLRCLSLQNLDYLPAPHTSNIYEELTPEYGSCASPALPGSEVDTKEIALQVTRIALQLLLGTSNEFYPPVKGKQYYWSGPYGTENEAPFSWNITNHQPVKDCPVCSHESLL